MQEEKTRYPEFCINDQTIRCQSAGSVMFAADCANVPCVPFKNFVKSGIWVMRVSSTGGKYKDRVTKYEAYTTRTEDEVKEYLRKQFNTGEEWYSNKLGGFGKMSDGKGFSFYIREPYLD